MHLMVFHRCCFFCPQSTECFSHYKFTIKRMTQFSINDPSPSGQEHLFDNYDDDNNDDNDDVNDNDDDDNLRKLCVKVSAIDPPVPQSAWTYLLISPTISNPLPPICQFSNTSQSSWKISSTFLHSVMPFHKLYFACWVLFHVKQQNYSLIWPEAEEVHVVNIPRWNDPIYLLWPSVAYEFTLVNTGKSILNTSMILNIE